MKLERIKNESGNWNESGTVVFLPHPLQWKMTLPPPVEIRSNPLQWKLGFDIGCESVHTSSGNKENKMTDQQKLIDAVLDQIAEDVSVEDFTAIEEMLRQVLNQTFEPKKILELYLPIEGRIK